MNSIEEKDREKRKGKGRQEKKNKKRIYVGKSIAASGIWELVGKAKGQTKKYAGHCLRFSYWA